MRELRVQHEGVTPAATHSPAGETAIVALHGRDREKEEELKAELWAGLEEPWWPLAFLPPTLLDDEGRRLWIEEMDFDPEPVFAEVRVSPPASRPGATPAATTSRSSSCHARRTS